MAEVVITDSAKTDKMEMKAKKLFKSSDFLHSRMDYETILKNEINTQ